MTNEVLSVKALESLKDIKAKYITKKRPPHIMATSYIFGYEVDND
jgi:hypothetical protein